MAILPSWEGLAVRPVTRVGFAAMSGSSPSTNARGYVAWIDRHAFAIVAAHVVTLAASIYLIIYHLPLRAVLEPSAV